MNSDAGDLGQGAPSVENRDEYRGRVREVIAFMKASETPQDLDLRTIAIARRSGCLVPVGNVHADDLDLMILLARWRAENEFAFPTRFTVTPERTRQWVRDHVLGRSDRLLFLLRSGSGRLMGHVGIANAMGDRSVEIDNVLRGQKGEAPGLMAAGLVALLGWIEEQLSPCRIFLRVLASNRHAVNFYDHLGFVATASTPLRWVTKGGDRVLEEATDAGEPDDVFITMTYGAPPRPGRE